MNHPTTRSPIRQIRYAPTPGYTLRTLSGRERHVIRKRDGRRIVPTTNADATRLHAMAVRVSGEGLWLYSPEGAALARRIPIATWTDHAHDRDVAPVTEAFGLLHEDATLLADEGSAA